MTSKDDGFQRPDRAHIEDPVAWLHTMWMEYGQFESVVSGSKTSVFGTPGRDHSECYPVTSEPLYRKTIIKKPRVRL